ncbi:hypothetical protein C8R44DRAFT_760297 [Mycena epipterygia]|nr:hypothetical protein C8R44DRAFT_760297 [Mycena epipterygia]
MVLALSLITKCTHWRWLLWLSAAVGMLAPAIIPLNYPEDWYMEDPIVHGVHSPHISCIEHFQPEAPVRLGVGSLRSK